MEKIIGVDEARAKLGTLVKEVSNYGRSVVITRRSKDQAVLIGRDEYIKLREIEAENARIKLGDVIKKIRDFIKEEGLSAEEVEEAIKAVRSLKWKEE